MPYTTVVAGTTITAAWANTNVRDQVVTPFANFSARVSAVTSPIEGMTSWIIDQKMLQVYTGGTYTLLAAPPVYGYKFADTSITASTTLQNDPDLVCPVIAGGLYEVTAVIFYTAPGGNGAGQLKIGWSGPSGATLAWVGLGLPVNATAGTNGPVDLRSSAITDARQFGAMDTSTALTVLIHGTLYANGAAGNLQLQWAQAAAGGTTTVKGGSRLSLRRIA